MPKNNSRLPALPEFEEWFVEIADEIEAVQGLLSERLSDDAVILTAQLAKVEAWSSRVVVLLAEANSQLDLAQHRAIQSMDRTARVFESEIELNTKVVTERRVRDILLGLSKSIETKLILGMSSRKQAAGEKSHHAV